MKFSRSFTDVCENVKIRLEFQKNCKKNREISESGDNIFSFRMNNSIQSLAAPSAASAGSSLRVMAAKRSSVDSARKGGCPVTHLWNRVFLTGEVRLERGQDGGGKRGLFFTLATYLPYPASARPIMFPSMFATYPESSWVFLISLHR